VGEGRRSRRRRQGSAVSELDKLASGRVRTQAQHQPFGGAGAAKVRRLARERRAAHDSTPPPRLAPRPAPRNEPRRPPIRVRRTWYQLDSRHTSSSFKLLAECSTVDFCRVCSLQYSDLHSSSAFSMRICALDVPVTGRVGRENGTSRAETEECTSPARPSAAGTQRCDARWE
jgi:hypothetical protein